MTSIKHKSFNILLLSFFVLATFSSCSLLETTPVIIPAYIYVPSIGFTTTNNSTLVQGEASSKFVDVWIYHNGSLLGNIGLPAFIPDPKIGTTEIEFDAGIMKSGQDEDRVPYPFVERVFFSNSKLSPNVIDSFTPIFKYIPQTIFEIREGFETAGAPPLQFFTYNSANVPGDTVVKVSDSTNNITPSIKLGKYSGQIKMAASSEFFEIISNEFSKETLQPTTASPVYLEIDYKSDVPININMWSRDQSNNINQIQELTTNPTSTWNKVYVCLDQDILAATAGTAFKISLRILNSSGIQPNIFIDNIKLLHF